MAKTSNIFARVEPEIKEEAESVLNDLGIPMSNAINIFLRQIILQKGIPFDLTVVERKPLMHSELTRDQFNEAIERGLEDLTNGRVISADKVAQRMQKDYDL